MEDQLRDRLDNLTKAILDESESVTEKILSDVKQKHDAAREASLAALVEEVEQYKKIKLNEVRNTQSRRITVTMVENRRELFKLRAEYSDKVFELLHEKLAAFTESPQYLDKLKQYLSRALAEIGTGEQANVVLRKADMKYSQELKESAEGFDLDFTESGFEVGGLMVSCHAKNLSIDMTYDTELRDLGGHFAEMFGLELE